MENVIQELSDLAYLPCKLVSQDGTIYDVPRRALSRCPFFEEVFNKKPDLQETFVDISDKSSVIFRDFLKGVECSRINNVFEIMAFACKIEWEDFQAYCARAANDIVVPEEISEDTIISVVGALVRFLPLRTSVQYVRLVNKCCRKDDLLRCRLFESVKTIVYERKTVAYGPLDIPFFKKVATVALMKNMQGQNITAILNDNEWLPVNLFGSKFCPFEAQVKRFHLSLGQYVVYQTSTGHVLMKDLQSDTPAKFIFETSKFFRSRCNQLHVIFTDGMTNCDKLYEWNDQTREFAIQISIPEVKLKSAHRNDNGHLIIVLEDEFLINLSTEKDMTGPWESLDGWKANQSTGQFEPPGSEELRGVTYKQCEFIYLGYNKLGTHCVHEGFYETIVQIYLGDGYSMLRNSILHRKVIAFSDLLLV